jgi:hypothetical protein
VRQYTAETLPWGWVVLDEAFVVYYDDDDWVWVRDSEDGPEDVDFEVVDAAVGPHPDADDGPEAEAWEARAAELGYRMEHRAIVLWPADDFDPLNDFIMECDRGTSLEDHGRMRPATRTEALRGVPRGDSWPDECSLYLMAKPGMLKIGISDDPDRRARDLTMACGEEVDVLCLWPFSDRAQARQAEGAAHRHFKHLRLKGEWFEDSPAIRAFFAGGAARVFEPFGASP